MSDKAQDKIWRDWTRLDTYLELGCLQELENIISGNFSAISSMNPIPGSRSCTRISKSIRPNNFALKAGMVGIMSKT